MAGLILVLLVVGLMPLTLIKPHVGILLWVLFGLMNPHRIALGVAYSFPFSLMIGLLTLVSVVAHKEDRRPLPWSAPLVWLTLFVIWMNVTTIFSLVPDASWTQWGKVMKIMVMTYVTMLVIHTKGRIISLAVVMTLSVAFYGIKGGIFTLLTGGQFMVVGPAGSLMEGNTEISLGQVMTLPMMIWVRSLLTNKWLRLMALGGSIAIAFAIVGSYSRGAFLASFAMAAFLWWKSERKMPALIGMAVMIPVLLAFMPAKYHEKMSTIETYEEDGSAMGRINAWYYAVNLTKDYPLTGGGFNSFTRPLFLQYAPDPEDFHVAHSIYFQSLGHHGYPGLIMFLGIGVSTWFMAGSIVRRATGHDDLIWAMRLARAMQVSVIGYAVGGAFLSLVYLDYYYYFVVLVLALNRYVSEAVATVDDKVESDVANRRVGRKVFSSPALEVPVGATTTAPMARTRAAEKRGSFRSPDATGRVASSAALPLSKRRSVAAPGGRSTSREDAVPKKGGAFALLAKALEVGSGNVDAKPQASARPLAGRRRGTPDAAS
ncbi:MAG: putative O-glycosylation ligase, exosortase A system-associated [Gammaproteobacteria bacterium]|nr:putative O-glycosylation ligase, exosortase A system-associated [Gammaproteobacteria bacterium]MCP5137611.1 putative O-glycosylation ligase, exosortase A system-associated [Gammaproteobacteria bacterium]